MRSNVRKLVLVLFILSITGCMSVAEFDQSAYDQAVSLKTKSITLMNKANESFLLHKVESDSLKARVEAACIYSAGRLNNSETTAQWEIMKDPGRSQLFGFLDRWEKNDHLNPVFIAEVDLLVADAFDTILSLELDKKYLNGGMR